MTRAADSVIRYSGFFTSQGVQTVLDYGTGKLRNALYLAEQGMKVYAADIPEQVKVLRAHPDLQRLAGLFELGELKQSRLGVDLVLCTYVFNIIAPRSQRKRYLQNVVANLRPGGYLLMELNSRIQEIGCGSPLQHYHCCDDKARSYTHDDLDRLLAPHGFRRISHYYSTHALAAVYRLAGV